MGDFARRWGFGGLRVGNLFALCSAHPGALRQCPDPEGPENAAWLKRLLAEPGPVLLCWGNPGHGTAQARAVLAQAPEAFCIRINRTGAPAHPLYLDRSLLPRPYLPPALASPQAVP